MSQAIPKYYYPSPMLKTPHFLIKESTLSDINKNDLFTFLLQFIVHAKSLKIAKSQL